MNSEAKFWDKVASKYLASPVKYQSVYEEKLKVTQEYLSSGMDVLEIGCGTGTTALLHAPFVRHIQAIDFSKNMIDICKSKAAKAEISNVSFECQNVFDLKREVGRFDLIMALNIIHVTEQKEDIMALVFDLLKPGGAFVISTPCLKSNVNILKYVAPIFHKLGIFPLLSFFNKEELVTDLKARGFGIDYLWEPGKRQSIFLIAKKN